MARADLPPRIPSLEDLYAACGTGFHLSLDVRDAAAVPAVVAVARAASDSAVSRLWLCHDDLELLAAWRTRSGDVRLVDSTRLRKITEGPERRAATLADLGVDAINMHATDWTLGLTTLFHRFDRLAFSWDAQFERVLQSLLQMGCDAVYSDFVDRMVSAIAATAL
jgi:glycerophosphoryl diester phosphodiesterase